MPPLIPNNTHNNTHNNKHTLHHHPTRQRTPPPVPELLRTASEGGVTIRLWGVCRRIIPSREPVPVPVPLRPEVPVEDQDRVMLDPDPDPGLFLFLFLLLYLLALDRLPLEQVRTNLRRYFRPRSSITLSRARARAQARTRICFRIRSR